MFDVVNVDFDVACLARHLSPALRPRSRGPPGACPPLFSVLLTHVVVVIGDGGVDVVFDVVMFVRLHGSSLPAWLCGRARAVRLGLAPPYPVKLSRGPQGGSAPLLPFRLGGAVPPPWLTRF